MAPVHALHQDVDMLRCKEFNSFTECVLPRRAKRSLPPLPEDKECSSMELKKGTKAVRKRRQRRSVRLPAVPEYDEC